jgi:hypothetical protein
MEIEMRQLTQNELAFVSGAGCYTPPPPCGCDSGKKQKNNNGYGNGPESGPPPGNSGAHNPTLVYNPDAPTLNAGNHPTRGFTGR